MPLPVESYIDAWKDNAWIQETLAAWQLDRKTGGGDFALTYRIDRTAAESPDSALALLVSLAEHSSPDDHADLAERLERLLEKHGAAYWEVINSLCGRVPQFRAVMTNVWGASLSKDLQRKVQMWHS